MRYIPLSLYIHVPWCIRKCPYCDFNSHGLNREAELPEGNYLQALVADLKQKLNWVQNRPIHSIFIGGGTPSLMSPLFYQQLFKELNGYLDISDDTEITLEANPGTAEQARFSAFRQLGINRLSIGVQSFQDDKLKTLGRVHDGEQAMRAVETAKQAGFDNFNLDLMFGLPQQTVDQALTDIRQALALQPIHLSWYQLTLEPNTFFYKHPPHLPADDFIWEMQCQGQQLLTDHGFEQYEISAYSLPSRECRHNLNYWEFGDYIGIGAGAHGKITNLQTGQIFRHANVKVPKEYMNTVNFIESNIISQTELPLEFMMNALRLSKPIPLSLFTERTGLDSTSISVLLNKAVRGELLAVANQHLVVTDLGRRFLNDLLELFLPSKGVTDHKNFSSH